MLGESESLGSQTGGVSWATVMRDRMAAELNAPVEFVHTTFIPTGERAAGIAARRVEEHKPDLVVVPVGIFPYLLGFVWLKVERLFGQRAGHWFQLLEETVNDTTYGKGTIRRRFNTGLRMVARAVIGTDSLTTREESARVMVETFRELAKAEDLEVAALPYGHGRGSPPGTRDETERDLYYSEVRAAAGERHFLWIDTVADLAAYAKAHHLDQSDGVHGTVETHTFMGEAVAERLMEHAERLGLVAARRGE